MNLQAMFDAMRAQCVAGEAAKYGQMALGGLMDVLAVLPANMPVRFDGGAVPGKFRSYRGYYEQLALDSGGTSTTVAALLAECDRANGSVMEGYKGGDYKMTRATWLNRAEYGCTGDKIVGASVIDGVLTIKTAAEQDDD